MDGGKDKLGFSLSVGTGIICVSLLLMVEIFIGSVLPTLLDLRDSYDEMLEMDIDQIKTDINITGIISTTSELDEWNNSVDGNITDLDSSPDMGNESNFPNSQGVAPDNSNMTIQENFTGWWGEVDTWIDVASFTGDMVDWETEAGTSPYIDTADDTETHTGSYIHEDRTADVSEGWFTFANTGETGDGFTVNFTFRCSSADTDDGFVLYYDETGNGAGTSYGNVIATSTTYRYENVTLSGTFNATEINNMRIYLTYYGNPPRNDVYVDHCKMGITRAPFPNYEIDFEYNWTTANYSSDNEILCIYVDSHVGNENLSVNYWDGDSWVLLGTISSTGWTNLTAAGLDSPNYTIQITGENESNDNIQGSWNIDCIFLHTWNNVEGDSVTITVKNTGSSNLKTENFNILLNGELITFNCQKPYFTPDEETNFTADIAISDGTMVKVITANGISDYEIYNK